jgi:hypothetical protein
VREASILQTFERWRFAILLACLLGLFLIQPMLPLQSNGEERIEADTALVVVLVACVSSLERSRSMLLTGLVLITGALAAFWIAQVAPSRPAVLFALVAALVAMSFVVGSLFWTWSTRRSYARKPSSVGSACTSCWASSGR